MPKALKAPGTGTEQQEQVIETAPGFRDQRADLEPGSFFNHLLLQLRSFMSFMSFLFRLLGKPAHHRSPVRHDEASMPSGSFLSFVPFLPFQFRLPETQPYSGSCRADAEPQCQRDRLLGLAARGNAAVAADGLDVDELP